VPLELPHPPLTDGTIVLRGWRASDVASVVEAGTDPAISEMTSLPPMCDRDGALAWIARQERRLDEGTGYPFCIAETPDDRPSGFIGLWLDPRSGANLGYWVAPSARGRGLAARAVSLVGTWAFARLRLARLEIWVEPANVASQRVAEQAGFVHEGLLRSYVQLRTRRGDAHMYALLPADISG
jgi:[ribosomal protein S5]-alanine N-acetyltransferase